MDYAICFNILAAESGWNVPALITVFYHGLNSALRIELVCRGTELDIDAVITLAISAANSCALLHPENNAHPQVCTETLQSPITQLPPNKETASESVSVL